MRLFTGISIPEDVVANLTLLLDALRPTAHLQWSSPYNFHITTKFIGEWPQERLPELEVALRGISTVARIPININGMGWFPNPHSPRILWTGIKAPQSLADLALQTDSALAPLGIPVENRPYSPHLTLARTRDFGTPLAPLRQAIAQLPSVDFGHFEADRFALYLSKPGAGGSIYTQLAEFPFAL